MLPIVKAIIEKNICVSSVVRSKGGRSADYVYYELSSKISLYLFWLNIPQTHSRPMVSAAFSEDMTPARALDEQPSLKNLISP